MQFQVAELLHMTLGQLQATMTEGELLGWCAYLQLKAERQDAELKKMRHR